MTEQTVVKRLKLCNWITLAVLTLAGLIVVGRFFAQSILFGGILVILNFNLLHRVLAGTINPHVSRPTGIVIVTYFLRLACTGAVLLVLIAFRLATPLGLLVGLSTVVLSLVTCGFVIIRQAWMKEA